MGLENLGSILVGEVVVQELVVSFPPSHFQLSFLQCIKTVLLQTLPSVLFGDFMDDQQFKEMKEWSLIQNALWCWRSAWASV